MSGEAGEAAPAPPAKAGYPPGIPFIIGNEAAERFSYYGMRAVLYTHLTTLFLGLQPAGDPGGRGAAEAHATQVTHLFYAGVYAFPMIGAILADRLLGKFPVILWVSILYCAGHGVLAVALDREWGMYLGLSLIALGAGGIKPCVSANVGDQFSEKNSHLIGSVYRLFYLSINFGSFFSTLLIPYLYGKYSPAIAFGVPGILMALAALVFWLGRDRFVKVPPKPGGWLGLLDFLSASFLFGAFAIFVFGPEGNWGWKGAIAGASLVLWLWLFTIRQRLQPDPGFLSVLIHIFQSQHQRKEGMGFFDVAREKFGDEAAEGVPAVLRIMVVFSMVSVFWALFDQHSTTWVKQAGDLDLSGTIFGARWSLRAAQVQSLNPILVLILIPILELALFGPLERRGKRVAPLLKMTAGMFITSLSFVAVAILQRSVESAAAEGQKVSVAWMVIPFFLLTLGEVLVSTTGLEFAYTQAPRAMKSTILGFWSLVVTMGDLLVAALAPLQKLSLESFFWTFALLMAVAAGIFAVLAKLYRGKTYLQQ